MDDPGGTWLRGGRAPDSHSGGRRFKSSRPHQYKFKDHGGFSLCGLILFLTKMFSVSSDALCRFIKTGKNSSSHMRSNLLKTGAERFIVLSLKVVFFFSG